MSKSLEPIADVLIDLSDATVEIAQRLIAALTPDAFYVVKMIADAF